jgi:hypothetical protein
MTAISLKIDYKSDEGLILSPSLLIERYLFGIPLCKSDGTTIPNHVISQYIRNAQSKVENWLSIKLSPEVITEKFDFVRNEWKDFGYVKALYPVRKPISIIGYLNNLKQIEYPNNWMTSRQTSDGKNYFRNIYLVPNAVGGATSQSFVYVGISPNLGWFGQIKIPYYWEIKYLTGYTNLDAIADVIDYIGKLAAIEVLSVIGDVLLGIGISNQSLSMDGLSQSVGIIKSGNNSIFTSRINQYLTEMKDQFVKVEKSYKGITFEVC